MMHRGVIVGIVLCLLVVGFQNEANEAWGDDADPSWVSKIISVQGRVLAKRKGDIDWRPVGLNDTLFVGDQIRVETNSRAGIVLSNDAVLRLDQNTSLVFTELEQPKTFILKLIEGAANFFSHRPGSLKIVTPFVNGVVEGTEFYVQVDEHQTRIDLFDGRILAQNDNGEVRLVKNQGVVASAGQAPQLRILAHPRDSVQWALYYPPVLTVRLDQRPVEFSEVLALFNQGRPAEALDRMETIAQSDRDARFYTLRAGLQLNVGRANQARQDIQQALTLEDHYSDALALQAVIAVVQNQKNAALAAAEKAVQSNPHSASAHIALSYAHQAAFNLPQALQDAKAAVSLAPDNGMAWARLSELQLSTGELDRGIKSAQKAAELDPNVAHAHTILGFANLTRIKTQKAREAFNQAIVLDSAAPLPRLGLGLAIIRDGKLEEGRAQIEIAAGMDPDNALIRSYLGKAYFDEKRAPRDEHQFDIAKELDPGDPTPWFYDAIRKQSLNRPVEALQDLQQSIELNDNRAVYRSRLLLDEDLAARSAGLGRIYNELNFQHLALLEGYRSLDADSTNYSAHRLLADNYAAKPRHEISRVSELLQSQLFQPLNMTPIQAQLAESDTGVITGAGPSSLSFNEFNPLFTRNRLSLQASGIRGNNHTWGDEFTAAGILDRISGSIASFHYETDGFRQNNDFAQDLKNIFLQIGLTPKSNFQVEYRNSQIEKGDISQNFDRLFFASRRSETDVEVARIGVHHKFTSKFEMVASYTNSDTEGEVILRDPSTGITSITKDELDGDQYEVRTDFSMKRFGLISGFSYMNGNYHALMSARLPTGFEFRLPDSDSNFLKENIYAYSSFDLTNNVLLTVGLNAASLKLGSQLEQKQLNPKFGLTIQPNVNTTFRLAAFRVLSNTYISSQTVEPTQVAGFSQFFDDLDGSDAKSYGIAVDHKFSKRLFGGTEYMRRDLDVPDFVIYSSEITHAEYFEWKEQTCLAYIYWVPADVTAFRVEYQYERFEHQEENPIKLGILDVETHRVPISMSYFHPSGVSFKMVTTYIYQDGRFQATDTPTIYSGSDNFWTIDTEVTYRLPKRWGTVSIGVKNLLDEEFNYQDTDSSNPDVVPGVFAFGKITLSF